MSRIIKVPVESAATRLSLAVGIADDYTGKGIIGDVQVSLQDRNLPSLKNPSGYYLFLDLEDNICTILVKGGEFYFDNKTEAVNLDELDGPYPVVNVTLKPAPSYPFSHSATVIRGVVLDILHEGIPGAELSIDKTGIETGTTTRGEFVIYFRGLEDYEVVTEDGKNMVKVHGKDPVLIIQHPDYKTKKGKIIKKKVTVEVEEGETTSISITYP